MILPWLLQEETIMSVAKVIGIDLGKSTFHLIGHDYSGREIFRHKYYLRLIPLLYY